MASPTDPGPLDWRISIVDKQGRPSPEFQRRWNTNRGNTALIGSITFGSGPPSGSPQDGAEYADTSTDPFTLYIGNGGTWNKTGITEFIELEDTPNSYSGSGTFLVRVNSGATDLEFVNPTTIIPQAHNPTATASNTAVNGSATTFLRSDAAPAVQLATSSVFGLVKPDGTTITISGGVISSTGGGGGGSWAVASNTTIATAVASVVVSVTTYQDALVIFNGVTTSTSGSRLIQFSTDGGITYWTTSGNYIDINNTGVGVNNIGIGVQATASNAARSGLASIYGLQTSGAPKWFESPTSGDQGGGIFVGSTAAITHIRMLNSAGNLTGGQIVVYGRT